MLAQSCPSLWAPWTVVFQAPLSMRFSREEYWSGLPVGVQPWWIQGIRRGDGVGVLRKNYLIRKEKLGKNVVDKKIEERKRLIFLGLHRKLIKS